MYLSKTESSMNLLELPEAPSNALLSLDGPQFHNVLSSKLLRTEIIDSEIKFYFQIPLHPTQAAILLWHVGIFLWLDM